MEVSICCQWNQGIGEVIRLSTSCKETVDGPPKSEQELLLHRRCFSSVDLLLSAFLFLNGDVPS